MFGPSAFFYMGKLIEYGLKEKSLLIRQKQTEDYISGRFG